MATETSDPIREQAHHIAVNHAELLPPFWEYKEWQDAARVIEVSVENAIRWGVRE